MHAPSSLDLIEGWDRAAPEPPAARAVALLALAGQDLDVGALAALPLGERERRLLRLRACVFGPRLSALVECEACGDSLELDLAIDDLLALAPACPPDQPVLRAGNYALQLRLPDSRDLIAASAVPAPQAASVLLARCVVTAECGGAPIDPDDLPPAMIDAAGDVLAATDPLADVTFGLTCVACGHAWQAPFDFAGFLWKELDAWAGRRLREVHVLASAYGWPERDILGMSAARRARYLRLVEG